MVEFQMSTPNRAVLIFPHNIDTPEENLLMLIMPFMLNN